MKSLFANGFFDLHKLVSKNVIAHNSLFWIIALFWKLNCNSKFFNQIQRDKWKDECFMDIICCIIHIGLILTKNNSNVKPLSKLHCIVSRYFCKICLQYYCICFPATAIVLFKHSLKVIDFWKYVCYFQEVLWFSHDSSFATYCKSDFITGIKNFGKCATFLWTFFAHSLLHIAFSLLPPVNYRTMSKKEPELLNRVSFENVFKITVSLLLFYVPFWHNLVTTLYTQLVTTF